MLLIILFGLFYKHTLIDFSVTSEGRPATETFLDKMAGAELANFKACCLCLSAMLWAVNLEAFNWCRIWALVFKAALAGAPLGDLLLPALWKEMFLPLEPLTVLLLEFLGVLELLIIMWKNLV